MDRAETSDGGGHEPRGDSRVADEREADEPLGRGQGRGSGRTARRAGAFLLVVAALVLVLAGLWYEFLSDGAASRQENGIVGFLLIGGMVVVPLVLYLLVRTARFIHEHIDKARRRRARRPSGRGGGVGLPA